MAYIGSKPANKPVVASDLDPTVITGQTALATSPASTDEFLISDAGVLKRLDASLIGGTNTPAFQAVMSSDQSFSGVGYVKASLATEVFDTNSNYDTSNYRFTPQVAGKYYAHFQWGNGGGSPRAMFASIHKNGSNVSHNALYMNAGDPYDDFNPQTTKIIEMNGSSDYLEFFVKQVDGTKTVGSNIADTHAEAYKIIE